MSWGIDFQTVFLGVLIFLSRITDVTAGTIRTIAIVHGRTKISFVLGFLEVSLWLVVITTVVDKVVHTPILGVFYALGFATGNVVGIRLERRMAFGHVILKVLSLERGEEMARKLRQIGFAVTTFQGEGLTGPVIELYVVCLRKDLPSALAIVRTVEPSAFYLTEQVGMVSKIYRPFMTPPTGWRAILKKK